MSENPPAFPVVCENGLGHVSEGMSLRDWFAGQAISNPKFLELKPEAAAAYAYWYADAMLAERSKPGVQS